jgi:hypothetical protein
LALFNGQQAELLKKRILIEEKSQEELSLEEK